ncbi:hypothetical protein [uncultured Rikenella sp.]|uniref:hypothetical protein n=1 Tax=uncultured Rikenella sp. TaxID=368003 RepID=UPI00262C92FF|nr:hypothetical protein [uncultured Rikenella sp.]
MTAGSDLCSKDPTLLRFFCVENQSRNVLSSAAPGFRSNSSKGALLSIGSEGSIWSASNDNTRGYYLRFLPNATQPSNSDIRGLALQLRCLSE